MKTFLKTGVYIYIYMHNVFPSPIDSNSYPYMKRGPLEKQCETNLYVLVDKLTL